MKSGKVVPCTKTENVYKETKKTIYVDKLVTTRVKIPADKMLEIALMAYNTAIELKTKGVPVIL